MNRKIICNTGPLIALSLIDRMDVLRDLFEFVAIPEEVHEEILKGGLQKAGLLNYEKAAWVKVLKLSKPSDALLATSLDLGEAAVIGLARELGVDIVLVDERKARRIARVIYGLQVIGSARILVEAKKRGLLDEVGSALEAMRDQGYRLSDSIIEAARTHAGEP